LTSLQNSFSLKHTVDLLGQLGSSQELKTAEGAKAAQLPIFRNHQGSRDLQSRLFVFNNPKKVFGRRYNLITAPVFFVLISVQLQFLG
jgi:hypothetical protein